MSKLKETIDKIDWIGNTNDFFQEEEVVKNIEKCNMKLAIWSKQFENSDKGNPSLTFVREMQTSGHQVAALSSIALYKPAASSMRIVFETALYYTYFRNHPVELASLLRNDKFYISKSDLLDYHKIHTPAFLITEQCFNLLQLINSWYSEISAIIHGQIPGSWNQSTPLSDLSHDLATLKQVSIKFSELINIVNFLFLCTVGKDLWNNFSSQAKKELLFGIPAATKGTLGLDSA